MAYYLDYDDYLCAHCGEINNHVEFIEKEFTVFYEKFFSENPDFEELAGALEDLGHAIGKEFNNQFSYGVTHG